MNRDLEFLKLLRILAMIEATTLIFLLGIAVPAKHIGGYGMGVSVMGPVHGVVCLMYAWVLLATASLGMWKSKELCRLALSLVIPFGGFVNAAWIAKQPMARNFSQ